VRVGSMRVSLKNLMFVSVAAWLLAACDRSSDVKQPSRSTSTNTSTSTGTDDHVDPGLRPGIGPDGHPILIEHPPGNPDNFSKPVPPSTSSNQGQNNNNQNNNQNNNNNPQPRIPATNPNRNTGTKTNSDVTIKIGPDAGDVFTWDGLGDRVDSKLKFQIRNK